MSLMLMRYGTDLNDILHSIRINAPSGSLLGSIAAEIVEMASCYAMDGRHFIEAGDPVNAVASFSYAAGWLDCGYCLGIIICPAPGPDFFSAGTDAVPDSAVPRLIEKTARYERLLGKAIQALASAPEAGTRPLEYAKRVLLVAEVYLSHGRALGGGSRLVPALASFSYGHAWLDAGLRAGLFRVVSDRDLFTV